MIEKRLAEEILGIALSGGGDFAEIYQELTKNGNVRLLDGTLTELDFDYRLEDVEQYAEKYIAKSKNKAKILKCVLFMIFKFN